MRRSLFSFSSLLLTLSFLVFPTLRAVAYKQQSIDINVNGQQRNMVVFTPNSLPAKSPLFIVTHGMNQNPEYQYGADKMYEMIDTAKFVVTYLRSDGNTWDIGGTKDQNFVIKTIDEMASRFDIDKDRVYWSGFSMGSMLIHHCIANMQDKIAAFAPTSGIQFSEQPWNNCTKPVNLLECIAYGDDMFGYEQYGIHDYIENYAKHDKHPEYTKTTHYKPINTSWYDGDLEKWTGGPNGGEVWLYSYNNGGHWPMDLNRHLIWNFCKRFSLNNPTVRITQPTGETTHVCFAPEGEATFPDISIRALAKSPTGKVVKVDFYDGKTLLDTKTSSPYMTTITNPSAMKHNLRVAVLDSKEKTAEATCLVNYTAPKSTYNLHQHFTVEDIVPQDWYVCDGSTRRAGGNSRYTDGSRILHFTNTTRAFDYGLFVQNTSGKAKASWAKFGLAAARSALTLHAGHYAVKYKVCNFSGIAPVTLSIQDLDGQEVASETFTPTINIGGDVANRFSRFGLKTFEFDIAETGNYVVVLYPDAAKNADFVLGQLSIQATDYLAAGIGNVESLPGDHLRSAEGVYDVSGRRIIGGNTFGNPLPSGLYIIGGRKTVIK